MAAVFAGVAQAPITASIIIFELTGDYQVILPLMFAVVLATRMSRVLTKESIYTLKLRRRGIDIRRGRAANLMEVLTVGSAMRPVPAAMAEQLAWTRSSRGSPTTDGARCRWWTRRACTAGR